MKRNLYYREFIQRENPIRKFFYDLFLASASAPRLLLEVFLRRNLGERYFSFSLCVILGVVLAIIPLIAQDSHYSFGPPLPYGEQTTWYYIKYYIEYYGLWYLFVAAFFRACWYRRQEHHRLPSVFDFGRYSRSSGDVHPAFHRLANIPRLRKIGITADIRQIETLLEPAPFLLAGIILWFFYLPLAYLLIGSSIAYSVSYLASYHAGDNYVMDKIDEMIVNEEFGAAFVDGADTTETRGFRFIGRRPADPGTRRRMADQLMEDDDDAMEAR